MNFSPRDLLDRQLGRVTERAPDRVEADASPQAQDRGDRMDPTERNIDLRPAFEPANHWV